jgi:predicted nucleic acid-binding protein
VSVLFVDTSFLLALELRNDQNHQTAAKQWQSLSRNLPRLVTTSYVFAEVVTYLNGRGQHAKAVQVGNVMLLSPSVHFVHVDENLFRRGWTYLQQHRDKDYSLTDCISFIVMEELGLKRALTFDQHFAQAGFMLQG